MILYGEATYGTGIAYYGREMWMGKREKKGGHV
jgi:hypothetical protein